MNTLDTDRSLLKQWIQRDKARESEIRWWFSIFACSTRGKSPRWFKAFPLEAPFHPNGRFWSGWLNILLFGHHPSTLHPRYLNSVWKVIDGFEGISLDNVTPLLKISKRKMTRNWNNYLREKYLRKWELPSKIQIAWLTRDGSFCAHRSMSDSRFGSWLITKQRARLK